MFTNMLSKILEENRNIDVIVGKMIAEKLMNENDTVMVIETVNHNCEEVYQEDYFLDGTRKMVRMSKDTVVFTNCNKSIEEMDDELQKYHCIRYDGYIYMTLLILLQYQEKMKSYGSTLFGMRVTSVKTSHLFLTTQSGQRKS